MSDPALATVPLVEEGDATGDVARVFADIKQTKGIGFIPNFWRALATCPALLEATWTRLKQVMHPEACGRTSRIDPLARELVALAVSATNGCPYCVNSHTAAAKKLGMDQEMLGQLMEIVALFNTTNALADAYQVRPDVVPKWE